MIYLLLSMKALINYSTHIYSLYFFPPQIAHHYLKKKKKPKQKYKVYIVAKFQLVRICYIIHPRSIYIKNTSSCVSHLSL